MRFDQADLFQKGLGVQETKQGVTHFGSLVTFFWKLYQVYHAFLTFTTLWANQTIVSVFSFQIFNAARQLSHIEAAPDKSGLVLLDYWFGLKRCLVIIHN